MCAKDGGTECWEAISSPFVTNHIYTYHIDAMSPKGLIPTARKSCQDGINRMETKRMLLVPWR